ncbi:MAG: hypothetical protein C4334_11110 [Pyrinomonas sp.]
MDKRFASCASSSEVLRAFCAPRRTNATSSGRKVREILMRRLLRAALVGAKSVKDAEFET